MEKKSLLLQLLIPAAVSACGANLCDTDEKSQINLAADREKIMELERKWSDMYGKRDLGGIAGLWAEDGIMFLPGKEIIVGLNNVIEETRAEFEHAEQSGEVVTWEPLDVAVASNGDMAYAYGAGVVKKPGGTIKRTKYLAVWVKKDGEWKVAIDMNE